MEGVVLMKLFERRKISLLKEKVEILRKDARRNGRFSLFDTKISDGVFSRNASYDYLKDYYDMLQGWDEKCNLPYDVGDFLETLTDDYTVMIHRTYLGLDVDSDGLICNDTLHSIMKDGLKNYGHMNAVGGGAFSDLPPSLTLTMTPLMGTAGYINLVAPYHSNDAIIVAAFPKELVNDHGEIIDNSYYDKVYDLSVVPPKVKSEFMVGAILKKNNGYDKFYTRDEIVASFNNDKDSEKNK